MPASTLTHADVDDDLMENNDSDTGPLDRESFEKIEVTLGKGERREWVTTRPYTLNQLLSMVRE